MPDLLTGASRKAAVPLRVSFGVQAEQGAGLPHCIIHELLTLQQTMGISCSMVARLKYVEHCPPHIKHRPLSKRLKGRSQTEDDTWLCRLSGKQVPQPQRRAWEPGSATQQRIMRLSSSMAERANT